MACVEGATMRLHGTTSCGSLPQGRSPRKVAMHHCAASLQDHLSKHGKLMYIGGWGMGYGSCNHANVSGQSLAHVNGSLPLGRSPPQKLAVHRCTASLHHHSKDELSPGADDLTSLNRMSRQSNSVTTFEATPMSQVDCTTYTVEGDLQVARQRSRNWQNRQHVCPPAHLEWHGCLSGEQLKPQITIFETPL